MVRLFDNTLRDGGNVVGHGFPIALTESIVPGAALLQHRRHRVRQLQGARCLRQARRNAGTQRRGVLFSAAALSPAGAHRHVPTRKARGQRACPPRRGRGAALPARRRERR